MKKDFDVIVIGAGINGQVMSLAAAHFGFSVALIDQNSFIENSLRNSSSELNQQDPMVDYANRVINILGNENLSLS